MHCPTCNRQIVEDSPCPHCSKQHKELSTTKPNSTPDGIIWLLLLAIAFFLFYLVFHYQGQPELRIWSIWIWSALLLILIECFRRYFESKKIKASKQPPPEETWRSPIPPYQAYELAKPHVPDSGKFECPQCHRHFNDWHEPKITESDFWRAFTKSRTPSCPHCETQLQWQMWPRPGKLEVLCWSVTYCIAFALWLYGLFHEKTLENSLPTSAYFGLRYIGIVAFPLLLAHVLKEPTRPDWRGGRWLVESTPAASSNGRFYALITTLPIALGLVFFAYRHQLSVFMVTAIALALTGVGLVAGIAALLLGKRIRRLHKRLPKP